MKAFIQYILLLTFSLGVFFCLGQDEYERLSKKEMRVLLMKSDSITKSQQQQISVYRDLTNELNTKISLKKDSINNYALRITQLNTDKSNLDRNVKNLKRESSDLLADKSVLSNRISDLNSELKSNNERIQILEKAINTCNYESELLEKTKDSLSKSLVRIKLTLDTLNNSTNYGSIITGTNLNTNSNSNDILNKMYFKDEYPKEIHCNLEFSGVVVSSLNGGVNSNDNHRDAYNLDEFIRSSHSSYDNDWDRDYYSNGNWNSYDNDYRNPKWQVFYTSEFIPKSKLSITNMAGTARSLSLKFDLMNGMMITLSNEHLEENSFLCQWNSDYFFGKKVIQWNLAHQKAGEMRDLFVRSFEINGEAYIALNNFQLLRLKNGFAPIQFEYNEKSEYYTFEGLAGNNKILKRVKSENSESSVLDPAYCIYLFKLVK